LCDLPLTIRGLPFCVASGTEWKHAYVPGETVLMLIVKGLLKRDNTGPLSLTKDGRGRDVFDALLKAGKWLRLG
jgi:hypothetical protein